MCQTRILSLLAIAGFLASPAVAADTQPAAGPWIRVNLIGYLPDDPKIAVLSGDEPLKGSFTVGDFMADIGPDCGAWGPFRHNYRLDFSAQNKPGRYEVRFGKTASPSFVIGKEAFDKVPPKLLEFMQLQRCGDNPVTGKKCHQKDAIDTETGKAYDMVGGWHDAADRIKHIITTSYCVAALQLAGAADEARYGVAFLKKLHPDPDSIYVQISDDRDHSMGMELWHQDSVDYGWGKGGARPAWPATGKPEGPKHKNKSSGKASLAGRFAAAFALLGEVETAESCYRLAKKYPGNAMSVPVKAPYHYGESTWQDDVEWGATELYRVTKKPQYLTDAIEAAHADGVSPWMGKDRHGHYEFFPYVNLGHWRLYPLVEKPEQEKLAGYYRTGLERVEAKAKQNPYRLGTPLVWCSCNDVVAFATQAVLYEKMTGDTRFRSIAAEARDWIFGRNPWGVSFVIGVPEGGPCSSKPHHMFYRLNYRLPAGGLVDGPVYKDINDSLKFSPFDDDAYARFQSDVAVYHDCFADFSTNEPIIDGTVSLLLMLEVWK